MSPASQNARTRRFVRPFLETLESRTVMSAPYMPAQIAHAYGFDQVGFADRTVAGAGQTIAIVDAYNHPNIIQDANYFSSTFNLPQFNVSGGPKLTVLNQSGGTKLPLTNAGWAMEIALDVEWAHAIAPMANIVLVEASSTSFANMFAAVDTAAHTAGVSVVSMSWGANEFSGESGYDSHFKVPGVTFVASSGDTGGVPEYPAVSPYVVAVGGTSLALDNSGAIVSETGWSGSGGGVTKYDSTSGKPSTPDVAYNGDPNTGFYVYDSVRYYGHAGWWEIGGTSAGAPQWAALFAIANQGRQMLNKDPLSNTVSSIYSLPNGANDTPKDFNDITSGSAGGNTAGAGYDYVTGRGSPIANQVIADLVQSTNTPFPATSGNATRHNGARQATQTITFAPPAPLIGVPNVAPIPLAAAGAPVPVPVSFVNAATPPVASQSVADHTALSYPRGPMHMGADGFLPAADDAAEPAGGAQDDVAPQRVAPDARIRREAGADLAVSGPALSALDTCFAEAGRLSEPVESDPNFLAEDILKPDGLSVPTIAAIGFVLSGAWTAPSAGLNRRRAFVETAAPVLRGNAGT